MSVEGVAPSPSLRRCPARARRRSHCAGGDLAGHVRDFAQRPAHAAAQDQAAANGEREDDGAGPQQLPADVVDELLRRLPTLEQNQRAPSAGSPPIAKRELAADIVARPTTRNCRPRRPTWNAAASSRMSASACRGAPSKRAAADRAVDDERDLAARDPRQLDGHRVVEAVRAIVSVPSTSSPNIAGSDTTRNSWPSMARIGGPAFARDRPCRSSIPEAQCRSPDERKPRAGQPASLADVTTQNAAARLPRYASAIASIVARSAASCESAHVGAEDGRPVISRVCPVGRFGARGDEVRERRLRGGRVAAGALERVAAHDPAGDDCDRRQREAGDQASPRAARGLRVGDARESPAVGVGRRCRRP